MRYDFCNFDSKMYHFYETVLLTPKQFWNSFDSFKQFWKNISKICQRLWMEPQIISLLFESVIFKAILKPILALEFTHIQNCVKLFNAGQNCSKTVFWNSFAWFPKIINFPADLPRKWGHGTKFCDRGFWRRRKMSGVMPSAYFYFFWGPRENQSFEQSKTVSKLSKL